MDSPSVVRTPREQGTKESKRRTTLPNEPAWLPRRTGTGMVPTVTNRGNSRVVEANKKGGDRSKGPQRRFSRRGRGAVEKKGQGSMSRNHIEEINGT